MAALGILIGAACSLTLARVAESLLYEVNPTSPAAILSAAFLLLMVALLVCVIPAIRAVSSNPIQSLRIG